MHPPITRELVVGPLEFAKYSLEATALYRLRLSL